MGYLIVAIAVVGVGLLALLGDSARRRRPAALVEPAPVPAEQGQPDTPARHSTRHRRHRPGPQPRAVRPGSPRRGRR